MKINDAKASAPESAHQHFVLLDGLRGVAAVSVVIFHRRWWWPGGHVLDQAFLAVDFFFLLSGFVIAASYDRLLARPGGLLGFTRRRVVRLYPMIVLAAVVSWSAYVIKGLAQHDRTQIIHASLALPFSLLLLPALKSLGAMPFFLNQPTWSLFYEAIINAVYAAFKKLSQPWILPVTTLAAAVADALLLTHPGFAGAGNRFGTLTPALARVAFPFLLGALFASLQRAGRLPKIKLPGPVLCLIVLASFMPNMMGDNENIYCAAMIFLIYPIVVIGALSCKIDGNFKRICLLGGELSYPLYVIHFPLWSYYEVGARFVFHHEPRGIATLALGVVLILAASFVVMKVYEEPVRELLRRKLILSGTRPVAVNAPETMHANS